MLGMPGHAGACRACQTPSKVNKAEPWIRLPANSGMPNLTCPGMLGMPDMAGFWHARHARACRGMPACQACQKPSKVDKAEPWIRLPANSGMCGGVEDVWCYR